MIIGLTGGTTSQQQRVATWLASIGFVRHAMAPSDADAHALLERMDHGLNNLVLGLQTSADAKILVAHGDFALIALGDDALEDAHHYLTPADDDDALADQLRPLVRDILRTHRRPGWDDYFMNIAHEVAQRSNCIKRRVGAVIARDRRIISTGYNGTPRGATNCNAGGCPRCNALAKSGTNLSECLCSHAEENSITQAAYHGISVAGVIIYVTLSPCLICTKMIINAGIQEVVYNADYPLGETSLQLLADCGVTTRKQTRIR